MVKYFGIITLLLLLCDATALTAQIHVNDKLDVGVGTNSITKTKLKVVADSDDHDIGVDIISNRGGAQNTLTRMGLQNVVENGTDRKIGITNDVIQTGDSNNSFGYTVGIDNNISNNSAGSTYGISSTINANTEGYGQVISGINSFITGQTNGPSYIKNFIAIQARASNSGNIAAIGLLTDISDKFNGNEEGDKYGIYNQISRSNATTKKTYGSYNYISSRNTGNKYGNYTVVDHSSNDTTDDHYGTYNSHTVRSNSGSPNLYGSYNEMRLSNINYQGQQYAVYGKINQLQNSSVAYGIYGSAPTSTDISQAGYFNGNVKVTGVLTQNSDERLKQNIEVLTNATEIIAQLQPKSYEFDLGLDTSINLPNGKQFGFLAQELELILPEIVKSIPHGGKTTEVVTTVGVVNNELDENGQVDLNNVDTVEIIDAKTLPATDSYKSINYIALIPILVQGIKEQQTQITAQQAQIDELKRLVDILIEEGGN